MANKFYVLLMDLAALLGLSTSYFGGILGFPALPYMLPNLSNLQKKKREKKKIRVYMDGCFDLMHYGHANALRQAKALGDELVVGLLALVSGLKWVDEVIADAPYAITEEFMNRLFNEHKIDYIIHGDDPCLLPDGSDAYALAKKVFNESCVRDLLSWNSMINGYVKSGKTCEALSFYGKIEEEGVMPDEVTKRNVLGPGPNARVVYIDGAFDLFHAGHVEILKSARQLGDFLLVGLHTDQIVSEQRGIHFPLMHLHERSLSVLACHMLMKSSLGLLWRSRKTWANQILTQFPKAWSSSKC
ncbi:ethanolamine-phosphate cytidylyltransferase-like protein [Tanacetum coccineum]